MGFNIGEFIVYGASELCRVEEKIKRCFDGITEKEYYRLIPLYSKGSTFYIPVDDYDGKVRKLLTKEEIYALIDEMPEVETEWCEDRNQRKNQFFSVLRSDDYQQLISMMRAIYLQRDEQISKGKKLLAADEKAMREAEKLIHHEFSFVLGIDEKDIPDFIESRIESRQSAK